MSSEVCFRPKYILPSFTLWQIIQKKKTAYEHYIKDWFLIDPNVKGENVYQSIGLFKNVCVAFICFLSDNFRFFSGMEIISSLDRCVFLLQNLRKLNRTSSGSGSRYWKLMLRAATPRSGFLFFTVQIWDHGATPVVVETIQCFQFQGKKLPRNLCLGSHSVIL